VTRYDRPIYGRDGLNPASGGVTSVFPGTADPLTNPDNGVLCSERTLRGALNLFLINLKTLAILLSGVRKNIARVTYLGNVVLS